MELVSFNIGGDTKISDYLDNHDKIGIGEPTSKYCLVEYRLLNIFYGNLIEEWIEEYYEAMKKELDENVIEELMFRFSSNGYNYKVAEDILEQQG